MVNAEGTMAAATVEGNEARRRRLNIRRGFLRLWLVLSVLWLIGVSVVYRPSACDYTPPGSPVQSLAPHDLYHCLFFLYWGAGLDKVAVLAPTAQEGLRWDDLTLGQRNFVIYRVWDTVEFFRTAKAQTKDDDWTEVAAELHMQQHIAQAKAHPEQFRYQLVPLKKIRSSIAEWSHPLGFNYPQELIQFLEVAFGIPLAFGCMVFLLIRVSRWIWRGFAVPT
jgi:hypothetical protein